MNPIRTSVKDFGWVLIGDRLVDVMCLTKITLAWPANSASPEVAAKDLKILITPAIQIGVRARRFLVEGPHWNALPDGLTGGLPPGVQLGLTGPTAGDGGASIPMRVACDVWSAASPVSMSRPARGELEFDVEVPTTVVMRTSLASL